MESWLGERSGIGSGFRGFVFAGTPDGMTNALTFAFDAIHQAPSPDEFGGEQAEPEKDDNHSGARSDEHDDASQEQCESSDDEEDPADLLDRAEDHEALE